MLSRFDKTRDALVGFDGIVMRAQAERSLKYWLVRLDDPSFVYVLASGNSDAIKVGRAIDVGERIWGLQTGNPLRLVLLDVIPGDNKLEAHLHRRLANDRLHGEWFEGPRVDPTLRYVRDLGEKMRDDYDGSGWEPHISRYCRTAPGAGTRRIINQPYEVRFVEPDPVIDPEVAAAMRDSVQGCSPSLYLGPQHTRARQRIGHRD